MTTNLKNTNKYKGKLYPILHFVPKKFLIHVLNPKL